MLWFVVFYLIKLGLLPLLQLMVPWFVVFLLKPGLLPLLHLMMSWLVVFLIIPGLLPLLLSVMVCGLYFKAWFVASLSVHGVVFVVYLIKPGFLPLQIMVLWFVTSLAALCHGLLFLL